jgi:hypothetical protein
MAKWRGDRGDAHLGQEMTRQMAVAAHNDRAAPLDSGGGDGSTWGSSSYKKTMGSFTKMSSSSSQRQMRRAAVEDGARQQWLRQR